MSFCSVYKALGMTGIWRCPKQPVCWGWLLHAWTINPMQLLGGEGICCWVIREAGWFMQVISTVGYLWSLHSPFCNETRRVFSFVFCLCWQFSCFAAALWPRFPCLLGWATAIVKGVRDTVTWALMKCRKAMERAFVGWKRRFFWLKPRAETDEKQLG